VGVLILVGSYLEKKIKLRILNSETCRDPNDNGRMNQYLSFSQEDTDYLRLTPSLSHCNHEFFGYSIAHRSVSDHNDLCSLENWKTQRSCCV
jgi:hypothetical protein